MGKSRPQVASAVFRRLHMFIQACAANSAQQEEPQQVDVQSLMHFQTWWHFFVGLGNLQNVSCFFFVLLMSHC